MVKRLQRVRKLPAIETIAQMDLPTFTNRKPLARYAQARTILMWLSDQRKLTEFYEQYCQSYSKDPSGLLALQQVLGLEMDEINTRYRAWVADLEEVAETGSDLDATLGISVESGTGDGVIITELTPEARQRSGLRLGSIITGINGRATRDLHELIRVLGDYKAGDSVQVRWRRGTIHGENAVVLIAR
jgi:predicted metalloprotease with PDZ domain